MRYHYRVGIISSLLIVLILMVGCTSGPSPITPTHTPTIAPTASPTTVAPTTPGYNSRLCTFDADCVPEQCCHPTSCINSAYKHVCTELCTMVCQGPIDCLAGHCGCVNGTCGIVPGPLPTAPLKTT